MDQWLHFSGNIEAVFTMFFPIIHGGGSIFQGGPVNFPTSIEDDDNFQSLSYQVGMTIRRGIFEHEYEGER